MHRFNLRMFYAWMYAQPGKRLLYTGGEIGQWKARNYNQSIDWHLLRYPLHDGLRPLVQHLNFLYKSGPAFSENGRPRNAPSRCNGSMRSRGVGIRRAGGRLGGIFASGAVDLVEPFGLRVVGLHVIIADKPRRRHALVMPNDAEILLSQSIERGTVHLGRTTH
jgi:hypothetical protein